MPRKDRKKPSGMVIANRGKKSRGKKLVYQDEASSEKQKGEKDDEQEKDEDANEGNLGGIVSYYMDVLADSMTIPKVIQLLGIFFLGNLIFVLFNQQAALVSEDEKETNDPWWPVVIGGMALGANLLQLLVVCYNSYKNYTAKSEKLEKEGKAGEIKTLEKPQLPEFEYIYAVFVPLAVTLLIAPSKLPVVASCIAQVPYLKLPVRVAVSYVTVYQLGTGGGDCTGTQIVLAPIVLAATYLILDKFVASSISLTEKMLLSHLSVALLLLVDDSTDVTLVIFRALAISFGEALFLALCLKDLYKAQKPGSIRSKALLFVIYAVFLGNGIIMSSKFLYPALQRQPWAWLSSFIAESETRSFIFKVWLASSLTITPAVLTFGNKFAFGMRRKIWHFAIFLALSLPVVLDPQLCSMALVGLFGIFSLIEIVRANSIPPFGSWIRSLLLPFEDNKDKRGTYVFSYVYLVLGVALPLWFNNCENRGSSLIGLVCLGLGDSLASLLGKAIGVLYWPEGSKTIEGSFVFCLSTVAGLCFYQKYEEDDFNIYAILTTSIVTAVFEGNMSINDNILVPVLGWLCMEASERMRY